MSESACCGEAVRKAVEGSEAAAYAVNALMHGGQIVIARSAWPEVHVAVVGLQGWAEERVQRAVEAGEPEWSVSSKRRLPDLIRKALDKHLEEWAKTPHGRREALRHQIGVARGPVPDEYTAAMAALDAECAATDSEAVCNLTGSGLVGSTKRTFRSE